MTVIETPAAEWFAPLDGAEDRGPRKNLRERRCILSGEIASHDLLIRLVIGPERILVADLAEKLPGHGFWLTASREAFAQARKKKLFLRAAKGNLRIPDTLEADIETRLRQRSLDLMGLARRAGVVAAGFDQVSAQLKAGKTRLLLAAADASPDSRGKIGGAIRAEKRKNLWQSNDFESGALGQALGRGTAVVHAGLSAHRLTDMVWREIRRLRGFCMTQQENSANVPPQIAQAAQDGSGNHE